MQTRKKSISLHALGVIPAVPRGSAAHRSTSSSSNPSTSTTSTPTDAHPPKRVKRSHTLSSDSPTPAASPSGAPSPSTQRRRNASAADKQRPSGQATPPPSPGDLLSTKLDLSGVNDDIVIGVLQQLEATGNRPHLIKELATALSGSIRSVESSSNPVAIISSRLTNYLRRPWTALAPCPLTKEQVQVHPRRVYYYLTTCPRQAIPDYVVSPVSPTRIITPSVSSGPDEEDGVAQEPSMDLDYGREAMSPSPELDEFELPDLQVHTGGDAQFGGRAHSTFGQQHSTSFVDSGSTPLEHDEREFTQTATSMANIAQGLGSSLTSKRSNMPHEMHPADHAHDNSVDDTEMESEEVMAQRNEEAAKLLFGHGNGASRLGITSIAASGLGSSPMLRPQSSNVTNAKSPGMRKYDDLKIVSQYGNDFSTWGDLKSPEAVGLNELDDMFGEF